MDVHVNVICTCVSVIALCVHILWLENVHLMISLLSSLCAEELCISVECDNLTFHHMQVLQMAMAQVFIPNPHGSIPPLHLHNHPPSPPLPSPPTFASTSVTDDDSTHFLPRAPPPSPEVQTKRFGPIFEIDPTQFESPRKSELSPSNSLDFSTMFTPNKSPLESEPQSPMQPSPGNPLDSAYCSTTHTSTSSRDSNAGSSSLSIPISPNSATSNCYQAMLSHSHSDADSFQNGLRSHTALTQHPNSHNGPLLPPGAGTRPRSHTHPSHTLTLHTAQEREDAIRSFHPHLPLSFDTAQPGPVTGSERAGAIFDSGYHDAIKSPFQQKKSNLKRKSNELGYDQDPMEIFSYDSYSETSSESEWLVVHPKSNKKACQEGENPIVRRQSSSFSGAYSYSGSLLPLSDGMTNMSAPPTPNHYTTPLMAHNFSSIHHPSLSPPAFSPHQTPFTPTPTSLQSMDVAEQGVVECGGNLDSLDSMDCGPGEHCMNMASLSSTLRGEQLEINTTSHVPLPPHPTHIVTVSSPEPSGGPCRSYSSGGYDFSLDPQLADGPCNVHYSSYDESQQSSILNTGTNAESRYLLSKSL